MRMKGLKGLLARARLIELSDAEQADLSPHEDVLPVAEEAAAQAPAPPLAVTECEVEEDKPLDKIFELAAVPGSVFPADKLLRLLDGLRTMDAGTRKTAVLAMDAADDGWQIADPLLDAQRKIAALESYKQRLAAQVAGAEEDVSAKIAQIKSSLERTATEIRKQISELEQLLQREVAKAAQETTNLEAGLRATREAAAREVRRMEREIERFAEIPANFAQPVTDR
jgi:hypothetical protein